MVEQAGGTARESTPVARSDHDCFGCGDENPIGLRLRFESTANGVAASFIPGPEHQGFENVVHGGIISAVLDEAMAWATAHAGLWAVTGEIRVRFRHPLHVGEPTTATARVGGCRGRVITTTAELRRSGNHELIATASAAFVKVSSEVEATWRARYLVGPNASNGNAPIDCQRHNCAEPSALIFNPACDDAGDRTADAD